MDYANGLGCRNVCISCRGQVRWGVARTFSTSFMSFLRRMAPIMELMGSAMPGGEEERGRSSTVLRAYL